MKKNFSLWIIGPSALENTISKIIYKKLKKNPSLIIVDGDKVRNLYENKIGYDKISRSKNTLDTLICKMVVKLWYFFGVCCDKSIWKR